MSFNRSLVGLIAVMNQFVAVIVIVVGGLIAIASFAGGAGGVSFFVWLATLGAVAAINGIIAILVQIEDNTRRSAEAFERIASARSAGK
jgi:uncharacterized membrane protein